MAFDIAVIRVLVLDIKDFKKNEYLTCIRYIFWVLSVLEYLHDGQQDLTPIDPNPDNIYTNLVSWFSILNHETKFVSRVTFTFRTILRTVFMLTN